jgi:hypothetical protein
MRNKWMNMIREMNEIREIRLGELMKLIPEDEFVIVFDEGAGKDGYQEEDAIYNGQVLDWWKEISMTTDMPRMCVLGFQARTLESVAGPVTMIVAEF